MATKTAIIGLGIMGQRMLEHMRVHEEYAPDILWDPNPKACAAALALAPEASVAPSADDAIEAADLVYLACPPQPRKTYALKAAAGGKALFLEKPLGVNVAASETLVAGLDRLGVPAAVNFTQAAGSALAQVSEAAQSGAMGDVVGVDIVVTYPAWPRAWQKAADWLRFRAEGGMTREVLSHFLFFSERVVGPLTLMWAKPSYPADPSLCETHMQARLEAAAGVPVTVMASVGGAQPDRQEVTVKGARASYRISEFSILTRSDGGPFAPLEPAPSDTRAASLKAQLDALALCLKGQPHPLATPQEALSVQRLIEAMLVGKA
ncbi:Gfo/Idh/MocA family oxidoreductase [Stappia stellulata]|uniref:Gfo/Idh/MocA family oxidoreductase n=1 Tax=Stappia stellulata TaxID=71235 RepID=UPI001CD46BE8|nr:Gfo/Idh/MocA family oxidoreductase [Stappia stellulata]MCA1241485.1 Gfo/Idh/MocA family oxidoreductase [Stappia stellulata]